MNSHAATGVSGIVFTVAAVVSNSLVMGPAVILLNVGLVAALLAWLMTGSGRPSPNRLVGPLFLASIVMQAFHFVEEYAGRLYELAPPLFNLRPLPAQKFLVFNLVWIVIFMAAAIGVFKGVRLSLLVTWFMALVGGIGNAAIHSWLSVRSGGYMPGLVTSLINLPLGIALMIMLVKSNSPKAAATPTRTIDDNFRSSGGS